MRWINSKKKTQFLLILLVLLISLGYAFLNTNIRIMGTSKLGSGNFNIHWMSPNVTSGSITGENVVQAAHVVGVKDDSVEYSIRFNTPGEFYEFTVDAKNEGNIDGMIESIVSTYKIGNGEAVNITSVNLPVFLNYTVTYADGSSISPNHELKANTSETYKVRIEYRQDIEAEQLPDTDKAISFSLGIEYRQSDGSSETPQPVSFATDSWDTIVEAVKNGDTSAYNVGDTKEVDMGTFGTHTLRVANTTTPAECSTTGFSQTACGLVLEFADIITTHNMNPSGEYQGTTYDYGWNVDGWPASSMRTYVNSDIYNALPTALKNAIIDTTVVSGHGSTAGETNFTSTDKLYLLSTHEVWEDVDGNTSSGIDYYDTAYNNTRQLDYYAGLNVTTSSYSGAIKKNGNSNSYWWLRSANPTNTYTFYGVYGYGTTGNYYANTTNGVSPAFRIGNGPVKARVTLNTNGGDTLSPNYVEVNEGDSVTSLPTPTRTGYYFDGWYTLLADGYKMETPFVLRDNIELFAKWKKSVSSMVINPTEIELGIGESSLINITNKAEIEEGYTFTSNNTNIATVDANGNVVGVSPGTTKVVITGSISGETKEVDITVAPRYTINYDANGGSFSNDSGINQVIYEGVGEKYSHTSNIDDTGLQLSNYQNNWNNSNITGTDRGDTTKAHVVTIPGASSIEVDVYYNGENTQYDWVTVWEGSHPDYTASSNYSSGVSGGTKLGGEQTGTYVVNGNTLTNMGHSTFTITGDTVTFGFKSDSSNSGAGYGYYAIVKDSNGTQSATSGTYEEPTKTGATFAGWYTDINCTTGHEFDPSFIYTNSILTVYAKYVYRINYNSNVTGLDVDSSDVEIGSNIGTLPVPVNPGYYLDGWYTGISDGIKITSDYTPNSNMNLFARWKKSVASMNIESTNISLEYAEEKIINITNSGEIEEAYTFTSSNTDVVVVDSGGKLTAIGEGNAVITITGSSSGDTKTVNVTVQYVINTINFDSNGGELRESSRQVINGTKIGDLPTVAYDEWHTFDGWWTSLSDGEEVDKDYIPSGSMTLHAKWNVIPSYTISFNTDNGNTIEDLVIPQGNSIEKLPVPTKDDNHFMGWYLESTLDTQVFSTYVPTGNITLYARWLDYASYTQSNKYKVSFDENGGSEITDIEVVQGEKIGDLPITYKDHYSFDGWYTALTNGSEVDETYVPQNDVTLYAKWTAASSYTINFDANGGIVDEVYRTVTGDMAVGELPTPTKENNYFMGWLDTTTNKYYTSTTVPTKTVTLKAQWDTVEKVARIGSNYYNTLQAAINDALTGEEVILLTDTTENITNNKKIIINGDKHTIRGQMTNNENGDLVLLSGTIDNNNSSVNSGRIITNKGILTVGSTNPKLDDGFNIVNTGSASAGIYSTSSTKVEMNAGSILLSYDGNYNSIDGVYVDAYSTFTMNGGVIDVSTAGSPELHAIKGTKFSTSITINNGVIKAKKNSDGFSPIAIEEGEIVTVNGGYIYSESIDATAYGLQVSSYDTKIIINGGNIKVRSKNDSAYGIANTYNSSTASIVVNNGIVDVKSKKEVRGVSAAANKVMINSGVIKAESELDKAYGASGGAVNVNEGDIKVIGNVTIYGVYSTANSTFNGGTIIVTKNDNETINGYAKRTYGWEQTGYTLTMNGGIIYSKGDTPELSYGLDGAGSFTYPQGKTLQNVMNSDNYKVYYLASDTGDVTVTYDPNLGSVNPSTVSKTSGEKIGAMPIPTRENYDFDGWYTAASGGNKITSAYVLNSNLDLYAHWSLKSSAVVTFDKNDENATGTMSNQTYYRDDIIALSENQYALTGYSFVGWNTEADGSGTSYLDKEKISVDRNTTLYAQWIRSYTLTFDKNNNDATGNNYTMTLLSGIEEVIPDEAFSNYSLQGKYINNFNSQSDGLGTSYYTGSSITILQDTSLYAKWEDIVVPASFETDSLETIIEAVKTGNTSAYNVGDTKEVDMGDLGTHTLRIANKSTANDCFSLGYSQTACGFVLEFADILNTVYVMNDPPTNVGSWQDSKMRTYVNSKVYNALPNILKKEIINTTVVSGHGSTTGELNYKSTDKLYLLSTMETYGDNSSLKNTAKDSTRQLDYYESSGTTISSTSALIKRKGGSTNTWWLRTPSNSTTTYYGVNTNGKYSTYDSKNTYGVSPAFRIGNATIEVEFDVNGGDYIPDYFKNITKGNSVGDMITPRRRGYRFNGWYTGISDGIEIDSNYVPVSNLKLYARWIEDKDLYNVIKNEALATYDPMAEKYTGSHGDSMDSTKSVNDIYYWKATSDSNASTISNKNNVIFADQCWQMVRTTDTGGVRMIYNGEADNGKCLNTRSNHVGYNSNYTYLGLSSSTGYWYGDDYTYDSSSNLFSISGNTEQTVWNATNAVGLIGKYTCKSTTEAGTCSSINYIESYSSSSGANVFKMNGSQHYSIIGLSLFNNTSGPTSVGYKNGDSYQTNSYTPTKKQSINTAGKTTISSSSSTTFKNTYLYSKTFSFDGSNYTLDNPVLGSNIADGDYSDYYTFNSATVVSGANPNYIINKRNSTSYYYVTLSPNYTYTSPYLLMSSTVIDNGDGTYSLDSNNTTSISLADWSTDYSNITNKYSCGDNSTTVCANPIYITSSNSNSYSYNLGDQIVLAKGRNGLTLTDTKLVSSSVLANEYSNYSDYKYTCGNTNTTCTEANLRYITSYTSGTSYLYTYALNHYFGTSVSWDGSNYTLNNPVGVEYYNDLNTLSTHHYMCTGTGETSCNSVAYVYSYSGTASMYYVTLTNGVLTSSKVLENSFTKNTSNSLAMTQIEAWYKKYLLNYDQYIDDTIYCNNRSIRSLGGWKDDGGLTTDSLLFKENSQEIDLSCPNTTDKFSISNNNSKLNYKVGLMTYSELNSLNNKNLTKTGKLYWTISPSYIDSNAFYIYAFDNYGTSGSYVVNSSTNGIRPAISLKTGIRYLSGNGSMDSPYVVDTTS